MTDHWYRDFLDEFSRADIVVSSDTDEPLGVIARLRPPDTPDWEQPDPQVLQTDGSVTSLTQLCRILDVEEFDVVFPPEDLRREIVMALERLDTPVSLVLRGAVVGLLMELAGMAPHDSETQQHIRATCSQHPGIKEPCPRQHVENER